MPSSTNEVMNKKALMGLLEGACKMESSLVTLQAQELEGSVPHGNSLPANCSFIPAYLICQPSLTECWFRKWWWLMGLGVATSLSTFTHQIRIFPHPWHPKSFAPLYSMKDKLTSACCFRK
jgi:hypothetical protein